MEWSGEWPIVNPGRGIVEMTCPAPELPDCLLAVPDNDDPHSFVWNYLGTPDNNPVRMEGRDVLIRCVKAPLLPVPGEDVDYAAHALGWYGRRQQHMSFTADVTAALPDAPGVTCGLMVMQNDFFGLRLEISREESGLLVRALKTTVRATGYRHWAKDLPVTEELLGETHRADGAVQLTLSAEGQEFALAVNGSVIGRADGGFMGSETCMGFVGAYICLYASGNGVEQDCEARFSGFRYRGKC